MVLRREVAMSNNTLLRRIRAEYLEMPGLRLTLEQAQRLCGVERTLCKRLLDALVKARFLCIKSDGAYARASDGELPSPFSTEADLRVGKRVMAVS
jgi:hypothetical protein